MKRGETMNKIGKIVILAMTLSLAFVLTACGGGGSSAQSSQESSSASASTSESASAASPAAESSADVYVNDYFGIEYDLPEGWTFEDVSAAIDVEDSVDEALTNSKVDMLAKSADGSQNVIVAVEVANDNTAGKSAEDYLDDRLQGTIDGFEGNYSYSSSTATITFAGIERALPAFIMEIDSNGTKTVYCQAVAEKDGDFMTMTSVATNEADAEAAFNNFVATSE